MKKWSKPNFALENGVFKLYLFWGKWGTVRYHEDQCTKKKHMFRIPTCGLFLTCTENSFLFCKHT
jgi:hypothetical protein